MYQSCRAAAALDQVHFSLNNSSLIIAGKVSIVHTCQVVLRLELQRVQETNLLSFLGNFTLLMMLQYSEAFAKMSFVGCNKVHMHFQGVHTRFLQIFSLSFQLCYLQTYKQKEKLKNHHLLADFGRRSMSVVVFTLWGST